MELSFIVATNNNDDSKYILQFLDKIFSFKENHFEVVIVDNSFYYSDALKIINQYFTLYSKQIQIITSYKPLDISASRNLAINIAKGNYLLFLHPTELPTDEFFMVTKEILKNKNLDCIEYCVSYFWGPKYTFESSIRVEKNKIYNLEDNDSNQVFALTSSLLSSKLFKKTIVDKNNITFRRSLQFDSFFVYAFLSHSKTFYAIDKILIVNKVNIMMYDNSFELINQWVHILNYYNNNQLKKKYEKELEYAFVRYALFSFLLSLASTKNPQLLQKMYDYVKDYITRRYKNFSNNPYLKDKASKNDNFPIVARDLSKFFKKYFNENKLKDDSRFWE
ncbi:MAG: glycosyltransferase family 2 protein [Spiroplasma sp.]